MTYKIALCDDEREQVLILKLYLLEYFNLKKLEIEISEFNSGVELMKTFRQDQYFCDVLFLDVEMDSMNGVEIAKLIRELNQKMLLIFVTSHREFAVDGFEVRALDYIIKPIQVKRLHNTLDDLLKKLQEIELLTKPNCLSIVIGRDTMVIPVQTIIYCVKNGNKVKIICEEKQYDCYLTMNSLKNQLGEKQFVQCHQGFIVNKQWISSSGNCQIHLKTGFAIPMSRRYVKNIKETIKEKYGK